MKKSLYPSITWTLEELIEIELTHFTHLDHFQLLRDECFLALSKFNSLSEGKNLGWETLGVSVRLEPDVQEIRFTHRGHADKPIRYHLSGYGTVTLLPLDT